MAAVALDDLLLSFQGRIGRGRFALGLMAIAVAVGAAALIFRLPDGTYCRMAFGTLLGTVYLAALAVMGAVIAAMLVALSAKRMADAGWWRAAALAPVLPAVALFLIWRLERFGPCGVMTDERAYWLVWAGVLFVAALSLNFLGPARRRTGPAVAGAPASLSDE